MATDPSGSDDWRTALAQEASRLEEAAKWSGQGQFEAAKIWRTANWLLGSTTAAASGIAGVLTFATDTLQLTAGALAIGATVTAAVHTTLRPDRRAELAQKTGNDYLALQGDARRLVNLDAASNDAPTLRRDVDSLARRHAQINHQADIPPRLAYRRAAKNIRTGGQNYEVDQ